MSTEEYEMPTDTKLRDMLQAKYGKPNYEVPEEGGDFAKGFVKGYNVGYDDGSRHAWQEAKIIIEHVVQHYVSKGSSNV